MTNKAFVSAVIPCISLSTENYKVGLYELGDDTDFIRLRVPLDALRILEATEWWWWPSLNDAFPRDFQPYFHGGTSVSPHSFRCRARLFGPIQRSGSLINLLECDQEDDHVPLFDSKLKL
jgi:hypothetical protein